uniref:Homeobox protein abdominal-A n=1 Tax=Caenorhabditis tropicalis TaxID=1561998 RepID=A0A1I7UFS3_9PELO
MTKRGPDDLQLSLRNGGAAAQATSAGAAAAAYYANVMTADSEPKKAKLDPTLYSSQFYTPTMHPGLTTSGASAAVAAAAAAATSAQTAQLLTGNSAFDATTMQHNVNCNDDSSF